MSSDPPVPPAAPNGLADYRAALARAFVPLEAAPLGPASAFWARVTDDGLSDLRVAGVGGSRQVVRRTRRLIAGGASDLVKVGVQIRGAGEVHQDGRRARLRPGDFTVYDTARPYELVFTDTFEMLVLVCPRARFLGRAPDLGRVTATAFDGGTGTPALASTFLRGLSGRRGGPRSATEDGHLSDAAVDLVAAVLSGSTAAEDRLAVETATVLASARRYIVTHLGDPGLSVGEVAAAHHVSVRRLQNLFAAEGATVTAWTRQQRLQACLPDRPG